MLPDRINLQLKLELLRNKQMKQEALLKEVQEILNKSNTKTEILERINHDDPEGVDGNNFNFDLLESGRIYHLSQIKRICIDYRLRFLSTRYFKGEIPAEALAAVKEVEKIHDINLKGFSILAPAKYFRLENADDPMLFAPIGNQYFYLLHKWGTDIHPLRKMAMWPLRNLETLMIFCFFSSFLLTFVINEVFFSKYQETSQFLILFMYSFKSIVALIFFYGISLGKNFSSGNWNSKFYNA